MKQWIAAMCGVCAIGAVVASAAQTENMDKKIEKDAKSMSVTGCVAEHDGHYMLNNAMMAGAMKDDMKPISYALTGGDLKAHVGHKVEVTGMMDSKMDKDKMDKAKMMDKDHATMSDMRGTLDVKSVKMMSMTCP